MEKKEFIKQWMKTYDPDTFKAGENGRYFYRSEDLSSGIDLECFFEDLLTDFESALAKESEKQSNCNLPQVSKCDGIENEAQLIAFISWYEKLSVEEIVWYDGKLLEAFKKAINCC